MQIDLPIKPLSSNAAYRGRRFETPDLKVFKQQVHYELLYKGIKPVHGFVQISYIFWVCNFLGSDADNMVKAVQDCLVSEGFIDDDRFIVSFSVQKIWQKKGKQQRIEISVVPFQGIIRNPNSGKVIYENI